MDTEHAEHVARFEELIRTTHLAQPVFRGTVHVSLRPRDAGLVGARVYSFDLLGHATAKHCFGVALRQADGLVRYVALLEQGHVFSPETAVLACQASSNAGT